jgi:hypothetical protein
MSPGPHSGSTATPTRGVSSHNPTIHVQEMP